MEIRLSEDRVADEDDGDEADELPDAFVFHGSVEMEVIVESPG